MSEKIKFKGCKHLDYSTKYHLCKIVNVYDDNYCWERKLEGDRVQFCGKGRGRINGIFQCINEGEMHCYEPQGKQTDSTQQNNHTINPQVE